MERVIRVPKQNQVGAAGGLLFDSKKCSFAVLLGPCDESKAYPEFASIQFPNQSEFVPYCEDWQRLFQTGFSLDQFSTNPEKNITDVLRVKVDVAARDHLGQKRYRVQVVVVHQ